MDDHDFVQAKILEGCPHRSGHAGGCGALEFEAKPTVAPNDQEVEFGAGVCGPEETFFRSGAESRNDHIEREAL